MFRSLRLLYWRIIVLISLCDFLVEVTVVEIWFLRILTCFSQFWGLLGKTASGVECDIEGCRIFPLR